MPDSNIFDIITAGTTAGALIPAALTAYFVWRQGRQEVLVETSEAIQGAERPAILEFTVTLRNLRRSSIQPWAIEVLGLPVDSVVNDSPIRKGPNWTANTAPFRDDQVAPGSAENYLFTIVPNWAAALAAAGPRDLQWTVIVSFNDRARRRKRWFRKLKMAFEREQIGRYV